VTADAPGMEQIEVKRRTGGPMNPPGACQKAHGGNARMPAKTGMSPFGLANQTQVVDNGG